MTPAIGGLSMLINIFVIIIGSIVRLIARSCIPAHYFFSHLRAAYCESAHRGAWKVVSGALITVVFVLAFVPLATFLYFNREACDEVCVMRIATATFSLHSVTALATRPH
jgi:hypothetical protein